MPGMTKEERQRLLDKVRGVYDALANRSLERQCTGRAECCRFRLTGRTPFLTRGEALVAMQGSRAAGRRKLPLPADGSCPMLGTDGRCTVYASRPFACRTHFCEPAGGPWPRRDVRDLIHELEDIDRKFGGSGGSGLPAAMKWAAGEQ